MNEERRGSLIDWAAFWVTLGVIIVVSAVWTGLPFLLALAWLPVRWGLARAVAAARVPADRPAAGERPFGYDPGDRP